MRGYPGWLLGRILISGLFGMVLPAAQAEATPSPLVLSAHGPQLMWRARLPRPSGVGGALAEHFGIPAIFTAHGLVVVGTRAGTISAFDLNYGTLSWSHHEGIPCDTPAVAIERPDGRAWALLANWRGEVMAVDVISGRIIWRTPLEGIMRALPVVTDTQAICTTDDDKVFVLDLSSGEIVWSQGRQAMGRALTLDGHGRPLVVGQQVYVGTSDGHLASYRLSDGERNWSRALGRVPQQSFSDADADPIYANGTLYVASLRGGIFALNPDTGATLWQHALPDVIALSVFDKRLWAAQADGKIHWFDALSGSSLGHGDLKASPVTQPVNLGRSLMATAGKQGLVSWGLNQSRPESVQPLGAMRINALGHAPGYVAAVTGGGWLNVWRLASS